MQTGISKKKQQTLETEADVPGEVVAYSVVDVV